MGQDQNGFESLVDKYSQQDQDGQKKKTPRRKPKKPVVQQQILNPDEDKYRRFVSALKELKVPVSSGKRSYAEQKSLYDRLPKGQAARPGTSDHEFWKAVDVPANISDEIMEKAAKMAGVELGSKLIHQGTGRHRHQTFNTGKKQQKDQFGDLVKKYGAAGEESDQFGSLLDKYSQGPSDQTTEQPQEQTGYEDSWPQKRYPWQPKVYEFQQQENAPQAAQGTQKVSQKVTAGQPVAGVAALGSSAAQDPGSAAFETRVIFRDKPDDVSNTEWTVQQLVPEIANRTGRNPADIERQLRKGIVHIAGSPLDQVAKDSFYEFVADDDFIKAIDQQADAREAALEMALESPEQWTPEEWERFSRETGNDPQEIQAALSGQSERYNSFAQAGAQRKVLLKQFTDEFMQEPDATPFTAGVKARLKMGVIDPAKANELLQKEETSKTQLQENFLENFVDYAQIVAEGTAPLPGTTGTGGAGVSGLLMKDPAQLEQARQTYAQLQMKNILDRFGSYQKGLEEVQRVAAEYDLNTRPLARPLEFAKAFAKAAPDAVSALLRTAAAVQDLSTPEMIYRAITGAETKIADRNMTKAAQWVEQQTDQMLGVDPDLQVEFMTNFWSNVAFQVAPQALGQIVTDIGIGGGAAKLGLQGAKISTALGMARGLGEQQEAAIKGGASENQIRLASLVAAVAAVPDVIPYSKWMGDSRLFNKFFGNVFQATADEFGDNVALQATKGMIARTLNKMKTFASGTAFESLQELSEKKINDAVASMTYDPKRKVLVLTDEDLLETLGGAFGGTAGAAIEISTDTKIGTGQLDRATGTSPDLETVLASYREMAPAQATGKQVAQEEPQTPAPAAAPQTTEAAGAETRAAAPVLSPVPSGAVEVGSRVSAPFRGKTVEGTVTAVADGKATVEADGRTFQVNEKRLTPVQPAEVSEEPQLQEEPVKAPAPKPPPKTELKVAPFTAAETEAQVKPPPKTELKVSEYQAEDTKAGEIVAQTGAQPTSPAGKLKQQRDEARRAAETDKLTGFGNRTAYDRALPAAEADPNTEIGAFDANNFGQINKKVSYEEGDKALKEIAGAIEKASKEFGVTRMFRQGGDEFVIFAPKGTTQKVINRATELYGVKDYAGVKVSLTGTVGQTFKAADSILQAAKAKKKRQAAAANKPSVKALKRTFSGPVEQQKFFGLRELLTKQIRRQGYEVDPKFIEDIHTRLMEETSNPYSPDYDALVNRLAHKLNKKGIDLDVFRDVLGISFGDRHADNNTLKRYFKRRPVTAEDAPVVESISKGIEKRLNSRFQQLIPGVDQTKVAEDILFHGGLSAYDLGREQIQNSVAVDFEGNEITENAEVEYTGDPRRGTVRRVYGSDQIGITVTYDPNLGGALNQGEQYLDDDVDSTTVRVTAPGIDLASTVDANVKVWVDKYLDDHPELVENKQVIEAPHIETFIKYVDPQTGEVKKIAPPKYQLAAPLIYRPPYTVISMLQPEFDEIRARDKMVSKDTLLSIAFKKAKPLEKEFINRVLESPMFQSEDGKPKKFRFSDFEIELSRQLLPLKIMYGNSAFHANYGLGEIGFTPDQSETHVYNVVGIDDIAELDHGYFAHWDKMFSRNVQNAKYVVKEVVDPSFQPVYLVIPELSSLTEADFPFTYPEWVRRHIEKVDSAKTLPPAKLTQQNMNDLAVLVTRDRTKAEAFASNLTSAIKHNGGLFGHARMWYREDAAYMAEAQGEGLQRFTYSYSGATLSANVGMKYKGGDFVASRAASSAVEMVFNHYKKLADQGALDINDPEQSKVLNAIREINMLTQDLFDLDEAGPAWRAGNYRMNDAAKEVLAEAKSKLSPDDLALPSDARLKKIQKELSKLSKKLTNWALRRRGVELELEDKKKEYEKRAEQEKINEDFVKSDKLQKVTRAVVEDLQNRVTSFADVWTEEVEKLKEYLQNEGHPDPTEDSVQLGRDYLELVANNPGEYFSKVAFIDPVTGKETWAVINDQHYYDFKQDVLSLRFDYTTALRYAAERALDTASELSSTDLTYSQVISSVIAYFRKPSLFDFIVEGKALNVEEELEEHIRQYLTNSQNVGGGPQTSASIQAEINELEEAFASETYQELERSEQNLDAAWKELPESFPLWARQFIYHQKNFSTRMFRTEIKDAGKRGMKVFRLAAPETGSMIEMHASRGDVEFARRQATITSQSWRKTSGSGSKKAVVFDYIDYNGEQWEVVDSNDKTFKIAQTKSIIIGSASQILRDLTGELVLNSQKTLEKALEVLKDFEYTVFESGTPSGRIVAAFTGSGFNVIELNQPDLNDDPTAIDLEAFRRRLSSDGHRTIFDRYRITAEEFLKERKDARWVFDHNGNRWLETTITDADRDLPIALFKADTIEDDVNERDRYAALEEFDNDFFTNIRSEVDETKSIKMNAAAAELIRRIESQAALDHKEDPFVPVFSAAFARQEQVERYIDKLDDVLSEMTRYGYPKESKKGVQTLRDQLENLENGAGVLYTQKFALPHEKVHEFRYIRALAVDSVAKYYDDFMETFKTAKTDDGKVPVPVRAYERYFKKFYFGNRPLSQLTQEEVSVLHEETFAAITEGRWEELGLTSAEAARFIEADLDAYIKKNGKDILNDLEVWVNEKAAQLGVFEKLRAGFETEAEFKKAGVSVPSTESRGTGRYRESANRPEEGQEGRTGVKDRALPKTVAKNTILDDEDLTPTARQLEILPHAKAANDAENWLKDQGFNSAYAQVFDMPPSAQTTAKRMAVIEYIDDQVARHTANGDTGRAEEWYQRLVTLTNALSPQYTEYGRAISQLARWSNLNPESIVAHTQHKLAMRGKDAKLGIEQQQILRGLADTIAALEKKIEELEAKKSGAKPTKYNPLKQSKAAAASALIQLKTSLGSLKKANKKALKAAADKIKKLGAQGTAASWINRNENKVSDWQKYFNSDTGLEDLKNKVAADFKEASSIPALQKLSFTKLQAYIAQQVALAEEGVQHGDPHVAHVVQVARGNPARAENMLTKWVGEERRNILTQWNEYLTRINPIYADDPFFRDFVWTGLSDGLREDRPDIPPSLDPAVLAAVYERVNTGQNFTNFMKLYKQESSRALAEANDVQKVDTSGGKWIKIPRTSADHPDFEQNAGRLRSLSAQTWCTSRGMERPYIQKGDFWIYQEGGVTELAIRFEGDNVAEIQGRLNNGRIPVEYLEQVTELQNSGEVKFGSRAQTQLDRAKRQVVETKKIEEWIKKEGIEKVSTELKKAETLQKAKMVRVEEEMPLKLAEFIYDRYDDISRIEDELEADRKDYVYAGTLSDQDFDELTTAYKTVAAKLAWQEMTKNFVDRQEYEEDRQPGDILNPNAELENFLERNGFETFEQLYDRFFPEKSKTGITKEQLSEIKNAESLGQAQAIYEYHTNLNKFVADNREFISDQQLKGVTDPNIPEEYRKRNFNLLTQMVGIRKEFESKSEAEQAEMLGLRKTRSGYYTATHRMNIGSNGIIGNPILYRPQNNGGRNHPLFGLPITKFLDKIDHVEASIQLRRGVKMPKLRFAEKNIAIEARDVELPRLQVVGANVFLSKSANTDFKNLIAVGGAISVLGYRYSSGHNAKGYEYRFPQLIRQGNSGYNKPGMILRLELKYVTSSYNPNNGWWTYQQNEYALDGKPRKEDSFQLYFSDRRNQFNVKEFIKNVRAAGVKSLKSAAEIEGGDDFLDYEGDRNRGIKEYVDRFEAKDNLEEEIFSNYLRDVINPDEDIYNSFNGMINDRIFLADFLAERYAVEWAEEIQDLDARRASEDEIRQLEERMLKLGREAAEKYDKEDPLPQPPVDNDPARPLEERLGDLAWDALSRLQKPDETSEDDNNDDWPDLLMRVNDERSLSELPKSTRNALIDVGTYKYLIGRLGDGLSFDDWKSSVRNELAGAGIDTSIAEPYYKDIYREVLRKVKQDRHRAELDHIRQKYDLKSDQEARTVLMQEKEERLAKIKLLREAEQVVRPQKDKRTALQIAIDDQLEAVDSDLTRDEVLEVKDRNKFFSKRADTDMTPKQIHDLYMDAVNIYMDATAALREARAERRAASAAAAPGIVPALSKEEIKQINQDLDTARNERAKRSHELRKLINSLTEGPTTATERAADWYRRLNRSGEALLTATVKTAAHNIIAQRGVKLLHVIESAVELAFAKVERSLGVDIFSETSLDIPVDATFKDLFKEEIKSSTLPVVREALKQYRTGEAGVAAALQTIATYRQRVVEGLLAHNPDLYDLMMTAFSYGNDVQELRPLMGSLSKKASAMEKIVHGIERYTHYGTALNRIQEKHFRFVTFTASVLIDLKAQGIDIERVIEEGKSADIPRHILSRAVQRAMEDTFSLDMPSDSTLDRLIKSASDAASWVPFMLNPLLFRRFFYNSNRFMIEHTPLILAKVASKQGFSRRDAAKFVSGMGLFLMAVQLLKQFGSDDDDPTVLNVFGYKLRVSAYNPLSTFLVLANFYHRGSKGKTPMKTGDELFQVVGIDTRYPNLALDWWKSIINLGRSDDHKYLKLEQQSKILGARGLAAFLRPLTTVKDIIAQFDEMEGAVRDPMDQPFRTELGKTVPLVSTTDLPYFGPPPPLREDVITGKPMTKKSPLLDQLGFTFINDNQIGAKFSPAEEYLDQAAAEERDKRPKRFKTGEERRRSTYTAQLFTNIDKGHDVAAVAQSYQKRGLITSDQLKSVLAANKIKSTIERKAKEVSIEKIVKAWELANDEERQILRLVLRRKVLQQQKSKSLTEDEKRAAQSVLNGS